MLDFSKAWATFPVLTTERLTLRAMTIADAPAHFDIYAQRQVAEAHGMLPYEDVAESVGLIEMYARAFTNLEAIRWGIVLCGEKSGSSDTAVIGTCGFHNINKRHFRAEIGYEIHPDYWRRGLASEAVLAVLAFGFGQMGLHRIEANVDPQNQPSAELLRRVGFVEEGYLRERFYDNGRFVDDWYFSILRHEFNC